MTEIMNFKPTTLAAFLKIKASVKNGTPWFNDINERFQQVVTMAFQEHKIELQVANQAHMSLPDGGKIMVNLIGMPVEQKVSSLNDIRKLSEDIRTSQLLLEPLLESMAPGFDIEFGLTAVIPAEVQIMATEMQGFAFHLGEAKVKNPILSDAVAAAGFDHIQYD